MVNYKINANFLYEGSAQDPHGISEAVWRPYAAFGDRPHWERMWIVQEVRLAQSCVVVCDTDYLRLENIRLCLEKQMRDDPSTQWTGWAKMWFTIRGDWDLNNPTFVEPLEPVSLSMALSRYGSHLCSDSRDRLYALTKVAIWSGHLRPPEPDYEKTRWDLAIRFVQELRRLDWRNYGCSAIVVSINPCSEHHDL